MHTEVSQGLNYIISNLVLYMYISSFLLKSVCFGNKFISVVGSLSDPGGNISLALLDFSSSMLLNWL